MTETHENNCSGLCRYNCKFIKKTQLWQVLHNPYTHRELPFLHIFFLTRYSANCTPAEVNTEIWMLVHIYLDSLWWQQEIFVFLRKNIYFFRWSFLFYCFFWQIFQLGYAHTEESLMQHSPIPCRCKEQKIYRPHYSQCKYLKCK